MTIATRNRFIRISTSLSLALVCATSVSIFLIAFRGLVPAAPPGIRPMPFLDNFFLTPYSAYATIAAIGIFPFFSLAGLIYILFAFEKTQTVEMTFFATCVFAVSLESVRLAVPLFDLWTNANFFLATLTRAVFFSRLFTLLALLASALFATGNTVQQVGPSIFLLAFVSFSFSNSIPLNSGDFSSHFMIVSGYKGAISLFFILLGTLSTLSYVILGKTHAIQEYSVAATGIILLLSGYLLLSTCDSWLFFIVGSVLIFYGARRYLKPLHMYYLWQ